MSSHAQGLNSEEKHRWEVDFSDFIRKFTEHDGIEFPCKSICLSGRQGLHSAGLH
jgi:hypothetical protein